MKRRKKVTENTLAANRRNAKRSTGPRTERGKAFSRFNAVRTGLFAKHVVIPGCDGDESEEEFARLLADVWREFRPEGTFEDFWVVQIAECMWRFRRTTRAESGSARNGRRHKAPPTGWELSRVVRDKLTMLETAQEEIKTSGTLSPALYAPVFAILRDLGLIKPGRNDMAQTKGSNGPPGLKIDGLFLSSLERGIKSASKVVDSLYSQGNEMAKDHIAEAALPPEPAMNKILHYERAAQKKFDWALQKLLESQQRRRKAQELVSAQVSSKP